MIEALIDKQDTAEIVRDQIAAVLAIETASQVILAKAAGKPDPDAWALRVYQERSNAWDNLTAEQDDRAPVVNVWWDSSAFDMSRGNVVERQTASGVFNIDCYGYGRSADDPAGGHTAGDRAAAESAQRAARLVRNILMAAGYTYLGLPRGTVSRRWVDSISMFQPQQDAQNERQIVAARVSFRVEFNEFSPQVTPTILDVASTAVQRTEDGAVVINADYDYLNEDF